MLAYFRGKVQNKQINHCHEKQLGIVNNQRDAHLTYLLMAAQLFVTWCSINCYEACFRNFQNDHLPDGPSDNGQQANFSSFWNYHISIKWPHRGSQNLKLGWDLRNRGTVVTYGTFLIQSFSNLATILSAFVLE